MPPLSDLEWQATVRDSAGRVVGRVEIGLLDQLGCYGAIVHRGQGPFVPIGMVNQVENAATLYQYLLPSTSRVNQVGFIEYTSDLEATVMAGATSCHPSARQAGAIRFDPDPLLTARFTVFGNPLWSPQCSIGRPNLFSAGAALLLLFSQA